LLIHQLREEINQNDSSIVVQQLQEDNKKLQKLVVRYKKLALTGTQTDEIHTEKTTAMTQTDEVQSYSYT